MSVDKKRTRSDWFAIRNLIHRGVMSTGLIGCLLLRVGAVLGEVTWLVAVEARASHGGRNCRGTPSLGLSLGCRWAIAPLILWRGRSIPLGSRCPEPWVLNWRAILLTVRHWRSELGRSSLEASLATLGSSMQIVIILLSQAVADERIECSP